LFHTNAGCLDLVLDQYKKPTVNGRHFERSLSIYDIPTYAFSMTGENRQHLLAKAFVLQLRRDHISTLLVPLLSKRGSLWLSN